MEKVKDKRSLLTHDSHIIKQLRPSIPFKNE